MDWTAANETEFRGTLEVSISDARFPEIARRCRRDDIFQRLIAENLERVVEEYLSAAEKQIAAMPPEPPHA